MTILIPMAGRGERFSKKGYTTPKPLIKIGGVPMVIKAVNNLPLGDDYVFIVLEEHIKSYSVDKHIEHYIPNASIIPLREVTEGQASTCLLGIAEVEPKNELLIGACDNGMIYDQELFDRIKKESDVIVFTFRNNITVVEKPNQYGWVKADQAGKVIEVSVKKAISNNPMRDHAIVGAFWFREAAFFKASAEKMITENRRINNEFYVDECINDALQLGYRVAIFEIDKYICWGTPDDLETYQYWESFF